ncbi:MAG: FAD:protein FMN transferase [Phycisphaerales bacterium JB037]
MPERFATHAMGTRFEVILDDVPGARAIAEAAFDILREQHQRLSFFESGSHLSRVNREAPAGPVPVDAELFDLLEQCESLRLETRGAFDIATGATKVGGPPPGPGPRYELDRARGTIRFAQPGVLLDLGGVAKGYALDLIREEFAQLDVSRALVHGGTSSGLAISSPPELDAWRIRVGDTPPLTIRLRDAAFAVSATNSQPGAAGLGHLIDPETGGPVTSDRIAVIVATSALEADAWATALALRGRSSLADLDGRRPTLHAAVLEDRAWRASRDPGPFDLAALSTRSPAAGGTLDATPSLTGHGASLS